jgi:2',3'-cyclic-nucleotide 2'-phosphodiesterase (5'-nucleotidase family)
MAKNDQGYKIMAFGLLYDFTGNTNVTKVTRAVDLVKESWFLDAINYNETIDLFLLLGHNPVRDSTFSLVHNTIRAARPDIPIQIFGGHSHIRDLVVYDDMSVGLESGGSH